MADFSAMDIFLLFMAEEEEHSQQQVCSDGECRNNEVYDPHMETNEHLRGAGDDDDEEMMEPYVYPNSPTTALHSCLIQLLGAEAEEEMEMETYAHRNDVAWNRDYDFGGLGGLDEEEEIELSDMYYVPTDEDYEVEHRRRPVARWVVESLPLITVDAGDLTADDDGSGQLCCTVCMDEFSVGEKVRILPCFHRFHADCIVRWLEMMNTCPVCRYELLAADDDGDEDMHAAEGDNCSVDVPDEREFDAF